MRAILGVSRLPVNRYLLCLTTALALVLAGLSAIAQTDRADSRSEWQELMFQPEARCGHGAVLDPPNEQIVLVAGWGGSGYMNDVWALQHGHGKPRWVRIEPAGGPPPGRMQYTLVYDGTDHAAIMFGGNGGYLLNDVWKLTLTPGGETWTEISPAGPSPMPRLGPAGVYDPINHRLVAFGGIAEGSIEINDTWSLDLTTQTWTELFPGGEIPSPRREATAMYDPGGHRMILFGGHSEAEGFMNDVWALSLEQGAESWVRLNPGGSSPGVRRGHAATYDWVEHRMLVFGGWRYPPFYYYNDVYALDLSTTTWSLVTPSGSPPPESRNQSAVFFAIDGYKGIMVFGGNVYDYYWYGTTHILFLD